MLNKSLINLILNRLFLTLYLLVMPLSLVAEEGGVENSHVQTDEESEEILVRFETNMGSFDVELYCCDAPKTVANFLGYVRRGFYEGTTMHRVVKNFVVQGGGYDVNGELKPTLAPVRNESKGTRSNVKGTVAMARTSDPHSASSQFYINLADNLFLDASARQEWGYAVFGRVVGRMDLIEKMGHVKVGAADVPVENIVITSVQVISPASERSQCVNQAMGVNGCSSESIVEESDFVDSKEGDFEKLSGVKV